MEETLYSRYKKEIAPKLQKKLGLSNIEAVPRIEKVVINVGVGEAITNKKAIDSVVVDITNVSGQKPVVCNARKSVSAFKVRKGMPIGVKVTLRKRRAFDFFEKLTRIVFPRIRDFKGVPNKCLDGRGNINVGINDQTLFPEVEYDTIDKIRGLEITIVTSAKTDNEGKALLEALGLPFEKSELES